MTDGGEYEDGEGNNTDREGTPAMCVDSEAAPPSSPTEPGPNGNAQMMTHFHVLLSVTNPYDILAHVVPAASCFKGK